MSFNPAPKAVLVCGLALSAVALAAGWLAFDRRPPAAGAPGEAPIPSLAGLPRAPRARVAWRDWGPAPFREAARSDTLILLQVSADWSHWSRLAELGTYSDPSVAGWISGRLVPVRVDADARPDLARRYGAAVPTTALLLPTGEGAASVGYLEPAAFVSWASGALGVWREYKTTIAQARKNARAAAATRAEELLGRKLDAAWRARPARDRRAAALAAVQQGLVAIAEADTSERRFPDSGERRLLLELIDAARWTHTGEEVPARLRRLLEGLRALEDPVEGGLFRSSRCPAWRCPEREKLLAGQAAAIEDAAAASARGLGPQWAELSRRTAKFVEARLKAGQGRYGVSLSADVERPDGWLDGDRYYAAPEAGRRAWGGPRLQDIPYSSAHAELASAYLATGDRELKTAGLAIVDAMDRAADRAGRLAHRLDGAGEAGLLEDQLSGARAALAAFVAARSPRTLALARRLLGYARRSLADPASGGLRVRAGGRGPVPSWSEPVDPDQTASFALLLDDLAARTGLPADRDAARGALDWALARPEAVRPVPRARVAVRWLRPADGIR